MPDSSETQTILDDPAAIPAGTAENDPNAVTTTVHTPGTPLPEGADGESSRTYEARLGEAATDTYVEPVEYEGIDTRSADANYDTRSNIVRP